MDFMFHRNIYTLVLFWAFSLTIVLDVHAADTEKGAKTFLKYCAGCHGFDGEANYEYAPSFSLGDRLQKDDRELLQSVLNGKNNMPPWQDKLPVQDLHNAIAYLRLMYERHERGEPPRQVELPDVYYIFKPVGEMDMEWVREEVKR